MRLVSPVSGNIVYIMQRVSNFPFHSPLPPLFFVLRNLIQKQLNYSLFSYTVAPWEMLQVTQDFASYLRGGTVMNKEDVLQDIGSPKIQTEIGGVMQGEACTQLGNMNYT